MGKKRIPIIMILIILIIISVIGITYAVYTWDYNTKIKGNTNCFDVIYTKGRDIGDSKTGSTLTAGSNFSSGLSTTVVVILSKSWIWEFKFLLFI